MARQKIGNVEFADNDVLEVEIFSIPDTQVCELGTLKHGKNTFDALGKDIRKLIPMIQDEDEKDQIKGIELFLGKREKDQKEKLSTQYSDESEIAYALRDWQESNNKGAEYRRRTDKDPKPLSSIVVLKNKGPQISDVEAHNQRAEIAASQQFQLSQQNSEMMKQFLEFMKSQAEKK